MSLRSRSPEKRQASNTRHITQSDQLRSGADAASRRIERGNPQTPPAQRFVSSTYSSPGSILGREEDVVILELTTRYLSAGIEGESQPQCKISFTPSNGRRVGDYREWLPEHKRAQEDIKNWGHAYELWHNDIGNIDLDLVGDKLERIVREAYDKYLLLDAGLARVALVLPSIVPHPVLDTILSTLFQRWRFPSITLLPAPTMAVFASGLRSALVVDIGWEESTVTVVHEYREVQTYHSTRAARMLSVKLAEALQNLRPQQQGGHNLRFDVDFVEEILMRALSALDSHGQNIFAKDTQTFAVDPNTQTSATMGETDFEVNWPSENVTIPVNVSYKTILVSIEEALFADADADGYVDDDEIAVSRLIFEALRASSADVRAVCTPRIVFTGELAIFRGITRRILDDLGSHINRTGWSTVKGQRLRSQRYGLTELAQARTSPVDASHNVALDSGKDYVEDRIRQVKAKRSLVSPSAVDAREVKSLGSWAGASMLTSLKVRGYVEIERDRYLSHGIAGASREVELSVVAQPQRMSSFGLPKSNKTQDRTSWTLAGWG